MVGGDNIRGDHFRFGLVFIKKSNQTEIFFKKNRNRTETGSNRPVSVFLGQKPVQTDLAQFSLFFLVLAWFFRFWLGLARFFLVFSVRFGFFGFLLIKPKSNRTGWFFQNFNWFNRFFSRYIGVL